MGGCAGGSAGGCKRGPEPAASTQTEIVSASTEIPSDADAELMFPRLAKAASETAVASATSATAMRNSRWTLAADTMRLT